MQTLTYFYVFSGLLLSLLSIPLIRRKIKPNGLYGFRTPSTMENAELWYKVNEYAGRRLLVVGVGTVVVSLALALWPGMDMTVDSYALSVTGVVLGLLLWAILQSYLFMKSQV